MGGTLQISRGLQPWVYRAARWGRAAGWDSFLESWVEIRIMEDILLSGLSPAEDPPVLPRKRKASKVLLDVLGLACQVNPMTATAAEMAPMNPLAEVQGPEVAPINPWPKAHGMTHGAAAVAAQAVAESSVAITFPSARPQGPGEPAQAYHYRQPLAITKEAAVVISGGMLLSIGLRIRRLRDGCSKLCFSPIGAVLYSPLAL